MSVVCRLLHIPRSVYYARSRSAVNPARIRMRCRVRELHRQSRGAAGSRTLSTLLRREGYSAGRWQVRQVMRECGISGAQHGRHRYRVSRQENMASDNLLRRRFSPEEPNRVWCGDISHIRTAGGWCYLALVADLYSRRVVGSALSLSPDAQLVCRAMRSALETRRITGRLMFHSDQGSQYSSHRFRRLLWQNGVIQSMSRRGNCLDNSVMERVFRTLKSEWIPAAGYTDMSHALKDIGDGIHYYNTQRPHSHNGGLSPCSHELQWEQAVNVS